MGRFLFSKGIPKGWRNWKFSSILPKGKFESLNKKKITRITFENFESKTGRLVIFNRIANVKKIPLSELKRLGFDYFNSLIAFSNFEEKKPLRLREELFEIRYFVLIGNFDCFAAIGSRCDDLTRSLRDAVLSRIEGIYKTRPRSRSRSLFTPVQCLNKVTHDRSLVNASNVPTYLQMFVTAQINNILPERIPSTLDIDTDLTLLIYPLIIIIQFPRYQAYGSC